MSDLDEAIILNRSALELHPLGHSGHATTLGNLAYCLKERFDKLGTLADLDEAIALHQVALDHPACHSERTTSLNKLVDCLSSRFEKEGKMADLDELVSLH